MTLSNTEKNLFAKKDRSIKKIIICIVWNIKNFKLIFKYNNNALVVLIQLLLLKDK